MKFFADVKAIGNTLMLQTSKKISLEDGKYEVDIKNFKGMKRSDRQNAMLWSIINKISKKENGSIEGSYDIYNNLLQMCGATYDDVMIQKDALERFRTLVKHIKVVNEKQENGVTYCYCWVFKGISEMDTKQANALIETTKDYASRVGVDVNDDYWKGLLNG